MTTTSSLVGQDPSGACRRVRRALPLFRHACKLGFEGIVSKRLTAPYRSGPSRDWIKVKNPDSPAMMRVGDHFARR
jgi:ATP-dependent DNA ligase